MEEFIEELKRHDLSLSVTGKDLILKGKMGKLTPVEVEKVKKHPKIISFIKENKQGLISFLNRENSKLDRKNIASMYGLSPVQEGILFHSSYLYRTGTKVNTTYHTQFDIGFSSEIDVEMFERAWEYVINKHTILRTGFIYDKVNISIQFVNKEVELPIKVFDFSALHESEKVTRFNNLKSEDRFTEFDFSKPPLMRVSLVKFGHEKFKMIWTKHHALWDGWSGQIIIHELINAYKTYVKGGVPERVEEDRYEDFINYLKTIDTYKEKNFWKEYLNGFDRPALLPFCSASHERNKGEGIYKRITTDFSKEFTQKITDFSKSLHITPNTLMQGVWGLILSKYTGLKDIVYGSTVSGRPADTKYNSKVGLYINTIPLRLSIDKEDTVETFLIRLQKSSVSAREFQHTSLSNIQQWNNIKGDLFDSLLSFTNYPTVSTFESEVFLLEIDAVDIKENNNYLLSIQPSIRNTLVVDFTFNSNILNEKYVTMISQHFSLVLEQLVSDKQKRLGAISLYSQEEAQSLLNTLNSTFVPYSKDNTIVSLFEDRVSQFPNSIALVLGDESISYYELNARSNQLARYLQTQGEIHQGDLIGICVDRSIEMVVGLLSILKAGGAYVPIDPEYPVDRINYILNDTAIKIMLVNNSNVERIGTSGKVALINLSDNELTSDYSSYNLSIELSGSSLAYVIYTSGTTGAPKGVLIEHENVCRLFFNEQPLFDFNQDDVWCLFHSYCFDFSVWEIFGALLYGGKLVMVPSEATIDTSLFAALLEKEQVTVLNQTPSAFKQLQEEVVNSNKNLKVRYLVFGGEELKPKIVAPWYSRYPLCKIINMYGITETTVHVTYKEITKEEIVSNVSNIGVPIPTMGCYLLDSDLQLVPMGSTGELYVYGAGLGRGYLNRKELTSERFIQNPFVEGDRLYKTGDIARQLPQGEIEYIGRNDKQVKIRGFRVELGEIEAVLEKCPYLEQQVLLVGEDKFYNTELICYVVVKEGYCKEDIISYTSNNLPKHMVPSTFIELEEIPLTINGKVDKEALKNKNRLIINTDGYVAPRTSNEEKLVEIWKEILNKERVGVTDDFFEFGGHSLKLTRLITRYYKEFGVKLNLKDLFINKTIELHSQLLFKSEEDAFKPIMPAPEQQSYVLSSAQHRMWILSQLKENSVSYSIPSSVNLSGYDVECLKQAIFAVIERHETLRTVFKREDNAEIRQKVLEMKDFNFTIREVDFQESSDAREEAKKYIKEDTKKAFNLEEGPLLKAALLQVAESDFIFYYNLHHIISDGVSNDILKRDVLTFYKAFKDSDKPTLPELRIQYKDYATWQREQLNSGAYDAHKNYWKNKLSGKLQRLDIPSQKPRPKVKTSNGATVSAIIAEDTTSELKALCKKFDGTMFMGVLSLWNVLFHKYTSQSDIILGTPIAGRDHADLENQIGIYFNTLVLRNTIWEEKTFTETFLQIKESVLEDVQHQMYPFDQLLDTLNVKGDVGRNPLYDVMLSYHNTGEGPEVIDWNNEQINKIVVMPDTGAKLDILINFHEIGQYLYFDINFNTDLYDVSSIKGLIHDFKSLLSQVLANPDEKIKDIDFRKDVKENLRSMNASKFNLKRNNSLLN